MKPIEVFDARMTAGRPYLKAPGEIDLSKEMKAAGAARAVIALRELTWMAPDEVVPYTDALIATAPGAYGLYPLISDLCGERKPLFELCAGMKERRIAGFFLSPAPFRIPAHPIMLKKELDFCEEHRIPVFYHKNGENSFEYLCAVMERHPKLTLLLSVDEEWPNQRKTYPLLDAFPRLHLLISEQVWAGALADMVGRFGAERFLYSSSYPYRYGGGTLLMVENAGFSGAEKALIYRENAERLIGGADL